MAAHEKHFERGLGGWILRVMAPDIEARREMEAASKEFDSEVDTLINSNALGVKPTDSVLVHLNSIEAGRKTIKDKVVSRSFRRLNGGNYDFFQSDKGMVTCTPVDFKGNPVGDVRVLSPNEIAGVTKILANLNNRRVGR